MELVNTNSTSSSPHFFYKISKPIYGLNDIYRHSFDLIYGVK
jgi:hypothetical protein